MSMLKKHWVVLGLFLLAPVALAEDDAEGGSKSFDVLGGFTFDKGQSAIQVGIGQPGLETKFSYGISSKFNVGGLLALNWGEPADFVLRMQAPIRYSFYDSGKLGLAAGVSVGIGLWFGSAAGTAVTIPLHMDFSSSYRVSKELSVLAAFEIPLELWTKSQFNMFIPLVASAGLEYYLSPKLKLWSRLRSGHTFTVRAKDNWLWASGFGGSFHVGAALVL
ncbi:MAG: hypothetical protein FWG75_05210 [Cystobacterineae bacterium]|nr:hypothetical protein [Cystobacterineae bacterium]